jgi:hypothetical protein
VAFLTSQTGLPALTNEIGQHNDDPNQTTAVMAKVVEAVRSLKHRFAGGKVPVRSRFRVACMVLGAAALGNIRRLHRLFHAKLRPPGPESSRQGGPKRKQERAEQLTDARGLSLSWATRPLGWAFPPFHPLRRAALVCSSLAAFCGGLKVDLPSPLCQLLCVNMPWGCGSARARGFRYPRCARQLFSRDPTMPRRVRLV